MEKKDIIYNIENKQDTLFKNDWIDYVCEKWQLSERKGYIKNYLQNPRFHQIWCKETFIVYVIDKDLLGYDCLIILGMGARNKTLKSLARLVNLTEWLAHIYEVDYIEAGSHFDERLQNYLHKRGWEYSTCRKWCK